MPLFSHMEPIFGWFCPYLFVFSEKFTCADLGIFSCLSWHRSVLATISNLQCPYHLNLVQRIYYIHGQSCIPLSDADVPAKPNPSLISYCLSSICKRILIGMMRIKMGLINESKAGHCPLPCLSIFCHSSTWLIGQNERFGGFGNTLENHKTYLFVSC